MSKPRRLDREALERHPLPPVVDGDKDSKGRILVIAGSREVPGAALLTALAAMRSGAGKLSIATVESAAPLLAMAMPEARVIGLAESREGGFAKDAIATIEDEIGETDAIVAGPGVGRGDALPKLCQTLIRTAPRLALDAAMLHCLGSIGDAPDPPRPPLLLPHAGEMASLIDCSEDEVEADPVGCGVAAAKRFSGIVLVKGVASHIVTPDGESWRYPGGGPGLGVSGSGDVLAGIAGGLLARGADPLAALLWAVWLHGESGAALARTVGPLGFLAREIPDRVPALLPR